VSENSRRADAGAIFRSRNGAFRISFRNRQISSAQCCECIANSTC
jgi:hypothetical protein